MNSESPTIMFTAMPWIMMMRFLQELHCKVQRGLRSDEFSSRVSIVVLFNNRVYDDYGEVSIKKHRII